MIIMNTSITMHATTILTVKKDNDVVIAADGQVTLGDCVMKSNANKLREFSNRSQQKDQKVLAGFAGSTADALTLYELLEAKLEKHTELKKACVELTKDCRGDKVLRHLEAMMIVIDAQHSFILTGRGDVLEPNNRIAAIGSGGNYALAAANALCSFSNELTAEEIAKKSMEIAADLCIYTNKNIKIQKINIG